MRKKVYLLAIIVLFSFAIINVNAITDADCQADADKHDGRCGWNIRGCEVKDDGSCGVNHSESKAEHCTDINQMSLDDATAKSKCEQGTENYSCVWNKEYKFCNTDNLVYVKCKNTQDIPVMVPQLISFIFNFLKIVTPIILVIISIITLLKALAASKEDEIKKAQNSLIKKLIAGALIFFIASIVQFVVLKVADNDEGEEFMDCVNCFLNNNCKDTAYYKTNISGEEMCTPLKKGSSTSKCNSKNSNGGSYDSGGRNF